MDKKVSSLDSGNEGPIGTNVKSDKKEVIEL
jgi:hypothetical protein